jgi:hypothetical protein
LRSGKTNEKRKASQERGKRSRKRPARSFRRFVSKGSHVGKPTNLAILSVRERVLLDGSARQADRRERRIRVVSINRNVANGVADFSGLQCGNN